MILACTGHRPSHLGGFSIELNARLLEFAIQQLQTHKPSKVISGMALGWDRAIASAALHLDIPYIAAVPFDGQHLKWSGLDQSIHRHLLNHAEKVVHVSKGGYSAAKMYKRNHWMVDQLLDGNPDTENFLLALWDGGQNSGTYECVDYAKGKLVKVVNCWEEWCRVAYV